MTAARTFPERGARKRFLRTRAEKVYCPGGCGAVVYEEGLCRECEHRLLFADAVIEHEREQSLAWARVSTSAMFEERGAAAAVNYDDHGKLVAALKALVRARPAVFHDYASASDVAGHPGVLVPRTASRHDHGVGSVLMTPQQMEAATWLLDWAGAVADRAYLKGVGEGESLLRGLLDGKLTPETFEDAGVERARRMQRHEARLAGQNVGERP